MDYQNIYNDFINDRKSRESETRNGYFEKHHITPKSLDGGDEKENIVCLTASDHLFAHKLLALIHGGSMWHALHMCNINDSAARGVRLNRRWYERARKKRAEHMKTVMSGKNHHFFGKKFTDEHRRRLSESHKGSRVGKDNNKYDPKIYDFRHFDGRHERLTKSEFRKKHNVGSARVSDICLGNRPSAHGWYVSEKEIDRNKISKKGKYHGSVSKEKYKFEHESGKSHICTQFDLRQKYPELNQSHLSSVCRGERKVHKGWRISG